MSDPISFDDLRAIVDALAAGFQALLRRAVTQKELEDNLRSQLERCTDRCERLTRSCASSEVEIGNWRNEIVKQMTPAASCEETHTGKQSSHMIIKAQQALQRLRDAEMPTSNQTKRCPVSQKMTDQEDLEHDFTTHGRVGDLGCPFAKMPPGADGKCGPDPIAEEFHGERLSGRSKSSAQAGSRCPIRFLDKHSPEEIAQYFENHKHEIPRSHQVCVKRYQQNEESIRQLDAKYGNLVSMIQGLGNKHKQYLPENEKTADEPDRDSAKAIEAWAENLSHHSAPIERPDRVSHFERPLRDIRVGESPSRPWGITVPVGKSPAASAAVALPINNGVQPTAEASASAPAPDAPMPSIRKAPSKQNEEPTSTKPQPQIVFNGPVFFGYSAEQAALFLQNLHAHVSNVS